ncbi:MAG: PTS sugar transporter subunit IIC [Clostridia bacterium]|nr:PTS sugar transporter subunit IIC [Clostridia bacterium]
MAKSSAVSKVKAYFKSAPKRYFITAFSGMAQGLFVTLIAGTILAQIAGWIGDNYVGITLMYIANFAKILMGAGIGVGIAFALKKNKLLIFAAAVAGTIGAWADQLIIGGSGYGAVAIDSGLKALLEVNNLVAVGKSTIIAKLFSSLPGNPIGSYVLTMLVVEIVELYAGKTKLDIILIPLGTLVLSFAGIFVAWPFIKLVDLFAKLLVVTISAGVAVKVIIGVLIAVVMGILLTMPTSSAAIWVAIATSNTALENPEVFAIAGGAAVAGCAAHMVGFAVTSYRENKFGGLISQGIGTSMLQIPNIMKKPIIMVPEIISSAFSGLVAVLLNMRCTAAGGGMGTSGLVGLFGVIEANAKAGVSTVNTVLGIVLCLFVIPVVISLVVSEFMRKKKWIKFGDMQLPD